MPETIQPPAEPPLPKTHIEESKSIFNKARTDAGLDAPPERLAAPAEPKPDTPPDSETPSPPKGPVVPEDIITPGEPTAPKVHDEVSDILSAELPKGAKKEQIESFGKLKSKAAERVQAALDKVAELEKKIGQGDSSKTEIEELRKAKDAAEEKARTIEEDFQKVAFEQSPKFKAQFVEQEHTALELAKSYLDGTEVKPEIIELAAHTTGRKRLEILKDAGIEDATISAILPHLANFDTIQRNKKSVLDNWKTEATKWREEQDQLTKAQKERRAAEENKVWDSVVSKTDLLPLRKSKDNVDWNNRGEQLLTRAKAIYNGDGVDLPSYGETILKGVAYDAQQEVIDHLATENKSLKAENVRLKSAAPGGSINAGTQDGQQPDTSKMSRDEVAKQTFQQELAKVRS